MMSKTWIWIPLMLILVANILYFYMTGFEHSDLEWASYAFIHIACITFICVPQIVPKSDNNVVFIYSGITLSSIYLVVEFIIGVLCVIFEIQLDMAIAIQVMVAALCLSLVFINIFSDRKTKVDQNESVRRNVFLKQLASNLDLLIRTCDIRSDIKGKLEHLHDSVRSGQVGISADVTLLDAQLIDRFTKLKMSVDSGKWEDATEIISEMEEIIARRNFADQQTMVGI